jgi:hypothetical protein
MLRRKPKNRYNRQLSPLENLELEQARQHKLNNRRYIIQQMLYFVRLAGLIALGIWGYLTRNTIRAFILDMFTNNSG